MDGFSGMRDIAEHLAPLHASWLVFPTKNDQDSVTQMREEKCIIPTVIIVSNFNPTRGILYQ